MNEQSAIFLDKDGTLVENVPYNVDPARIRLAPGAAEGLPWLHAAGFRMIVISNQSGVARGLFREDALTAVHEELRRLLAELGVELAGFYYCPHHPEGVIPEYQRPCVCRKPAPGLILQAMGEHGIRPEGSWFVGDILDDVEAGHRAGCRSILIDNGNETEWRRSAVRWPDVVAADLADAARVILADAAVSRRIQSQLRRPPDGSREDVREPQPRALRPSDADDVSISAKGIGRGNPGSVPERGPACGNSTDNVTSLKRATCRRGSFRSSIQIDPRLQESDWP